MGNLKIYLVVGSTGEYSDYQEWFVAAYADPAEARKHCALASARFRELLQLHGDYALRRAAQDQNEFDRQMRVDYPRLTNYGVAEVDFFERVPGTENNG